MICAAEDLGLVAAALPGTTSAQIRTTRTAGAKRLTRRRVFVVTVSGLRG
jgi:hypothetical protein